MPRTPENVAGANHASGYTGNTNEHKYYRELYEVLTDGLLFSSAAAKKVITVGGIIQVDQFVDLGDKECEEICTAIRKDGTTCGPLSKKNLQLLCDVARFHDHIGREIVWLSVTKSWVYGFEDLFKLQVKYSMPDVTFPKVDKKDLTDPRKLKEDILARFSQYRNADGVSMDYPLREHLIPVESPTFGAADSIYDSLDQELKLRYPMLEGDDAFDHTKTPEEVEVLEKDGPFTPIYRRNRTWIYHKAKYMFGDTALWNHAAGHKAGEDGRGGLLAIFSFMFGHEYSKSLVTKTIDLMEAMYYNGQTANYDFDMHVTNFAGHASTLATLEDEGQYRGMDDDKLVDIFLGTIKADFFDASKNAIFNDPKMRYDWKAAAKHMKTFLESTPAFRNTSRARGGGGRGGGRRISEAKTLRGGGGGGRGDFKRRGGKVDFPEEDLKKAMSKIRRENNLAKDDKNFFIPTQIYNGYGPLEVQAIWLMRGGKSRKRGRGGDKAGDDDASQLTSVSAVSVLTSKVDSIADSVAKLSQLALKEARKSREADSSDDEASLFPLPDTDDDQSVSSERSHTSKRRKKSTNRNHPALTRHPSAARQGI